MSRKPAIRRRRRALWEQSPFCRNCGIETILPEALEQKFGHHKKVPRELHLRMATIEHKNDRILGPRPPHNWGKKTLTLWCFKCNNVDNALKQAALREQVRERSGKWPAFTKLLFAEMLLNFHKATS